MGRPSGRPYPPKHAYNQYIYGHLAHKGPSAEGLPHPEGIPPRSPSTRPHTIAGGEERVQPSLFFFNWARSARRVGFRFPSHSGCQPTAKGRRMPPLAVRDRSLTATRSVAVHRSIGPEVRWTFGPSDLRSDGLGRPRVPRPWGYPRPGPSGVQKRQKNTSSGLPLSGRLFEKNAFFAVLTGPRPVQPALRKNSVLASLGKGGLMGR